jgi:hypothetical protein
MRQVRVGQYFTLIILAHFPPRPLMRYTTITTKSTPFSSLPTSRKRPRSTRNINTAHLSLWQYSRPIWTSQMSVYLDGLSWCSQAGLSCSDSLEVLCQKYSRRLRFGNKIELWYILLYSYSYCRLTEVI